MKTGSDAVFTAVLLLVIPLQGEIPRPDDAPKPVPAAEAAATFKLPEGLHMKLVASEPLIREPSGVCWDEMGRFFVCELHGYNVEGQYDIDDLNKTGELDLQVRRIQASEDAKKRAEPENYGTVKLLKDTDGDGVMDKSIIWADRLPLCYGLVPARGGVIVACPPDIVYLADLDGDDQPEVKETLFTGFGVGQPERGVNAPTWGVDNWIYFGRGHSGGKISGPHLKEAVTIGNTDFRIRTDGSAIEPVTGSAKTIGMAFTEGGDRFVTTTTSPGNFVTPISAHYFLRNPDAAAPVADSNAADYNQCYPLAHPHPWRVKREQHAEYFAFYKKISLSDAAASGYFTSGCSPLVYNDKLLPGLQGTYLMCEPAQNLIHRSIIKLEGPRLALRRHPEDEKSEFLASTDGWFHPIQLQSAPDGSIAIVDFYREIIEDYSAIPRHLQQQYGVINGHDRGRIWMLAPTDHPKLSIKPMARLGKDELVQKIGSGTSWECLTARRLLIERQLLTGQDVMTLPEEASAALSMLYAWEGCNALTDASLLKAWQHPNPFIKREVLRIADNRFEDIGKGVEEDILSEQPVMDARVALQAALSIGNSKSPGKLAALARLASSHGSVQWMDSAIASSAHLIELPLLQQLASAPQEALPVALNLAGIIATRGQAAEIKEALASLPQEPHLSKAKELLQLGLDDANSTKPVVNIPAPVAPTPEQLAEITKRLPTFQKALTGKPDIGAGRQMFTAVCGACHRSHGIGVSVGPDLDAEFQRAPEVILRDILFPHEAQRPGFETVMAKSARGDAFVGVAISESPTSITLRMAGGIEKTLLRQKASISTLRNISVMPSGLADALTPEQVANIIAFLRSPP